MNEFNNNTNKELIDSIATALGSDYTLVKTTRENRLREPQFRHDPSETLFKIKIENRMQIYILDYIECVQTTTDAENLIRLKIKEVMYNIIQRKINYNQ